MTRDEVRDVVLATLREAQEALSESDTKFSEEQSPFDAIPELDSLVTVELTTSICAALGVTEFDSNPFLSEDDPPTIAHIIDSFVDLARTGI